MSPLHFASPKTGHPWVTGLGQELFRHWYSSAEDRIAPLADCTVQAEGFSTVLTSRNIGESGTWEPPQCCASVAGEKDSLYCHRFLFRECAKIPPDVYFCRAFALNMYGGKMCYYRF